MYPLQNTITVFVYAWLAVSSSQSISASEHPQCDDAFIASISGADAITELHLRNLLVAHGISCKIEGSVSYGVCVAHVDRDRALRLIETDLQSHKYDIILFPSSDGTGDEIKYSVNKDRWQNIASQVRFDDLATRANATDRMDLDALLDLPDLKREFLAFPYVVYIKSLERDYFDQHATVRSAHEFIIELAVSLDEQIGGKRLHFQVWDKGAQILQIGSNEWWHGTPPQVQNNKRIFDKREAAARLK